jgi:hypothetical protein
MMTSAKPRHATDRINAQNFLARFMLPLESHGTQAVNSIHRKNDSDQAKMLRPA